jgi:hypothetical protein
MNRLYFVTIVLITFLIQVRQIVRRMRSVKIKSFFLQAHSLILKDAAENLSRQLDVNPTPAPTVATTTQPITPNSLVVGAGPSATNPNATAPGN